MKKKTKEQVLIDFNKVHGEKYDYSLVEYINNNIKVKIMCKKHNIIFEQTPGNHLSGKGCGLCSIDIRSIYRRKTKEQVLIDFNKIHGEKYDYSLVNYINNNTKVKIICKHHNIIFEQSSSSHLNGSGCPYCWNEIHKVSKEEFIRRSILIHGNKYDYSLVEYIDGNTKVKIICPEHGIFNQTPNNHMIKNGCSYCSNNKKSNTNEFIKRSNIIHNNFYDYSLVKYINSYTKVKIICPEHGLFEQNPHCHITKKQGCHECNESKGEKYITSFLINKNIEYIREKRFIDCKYKNTLPFDFYLPNYNTCIEFDGIQHYLPINKWGGEKRLKRIQLCDQIKNEYCYCNNIRLVRIRFDENIEQKLNELFNT